MSLTPTVTISKVYHSQVIASLLDDVEDDIRETLEPVEVQARWVSEAARNGQLSLDDPQALRREVTAIMATTPQMIGVALALDADGRFLRIPRSPSLATLMDRLGSEANAYSLELLDRMREVREPVWGNLVWSPELNQPLINMLTPLRDAEDRFVGVMFHAVVVGQLTEVIKDADADHENFTPFILYGKDRLLAHPDFTVPEVTVQSRLQQVPEERVFEKIPFVSDYKDKILALGMDDGLEEPDLMDPIANTILRGIDMDAGGYFVYELREIPSFGVTPWIVGIYFNGEAVGSKGVELINEIAIGAALALGLGLVIAIKTGRRLARPIKRLALVAQTVGEGKLNDVPELPPSTIRELDDARLSFKVMVDGLRERQVIRDVMGKYVPSEIATRLIHGQGALEPVGSEATVLFADIAGFTRLTEDLGPAGIIDVLNDYFSVVVKVLETHGGVVTQFQGDAILATFNVPIDNNSHASNAIIAAREMIRAVAGPATFGGQSLSIRIGVNTGPVVAGAVGAEGRLNYTVHGDAVNLAARLEAMNKELGTRLLVSKSSLDQSGATGFRTVGSMAVRGQSQKVQVFTRDDL